MSLRGDAISDSNANDPASRPAAPAGLRWGDADLPAPPAADRSSASGEREVKGVFGVPKPPPPAGASLAGTPNADPLASLFASDTIVKAPGIHDAPSEAELGRWRATMQSSLFEERVVDPAPPQISLPPAPTARIELDSDIPAAPPRVAAPVAVAPPPARAPVRESPPRELAEALPRRPSRSEPEPDEPQPRAEKSRSTKSTGKRRRAAAEAAAAAAAAAAAEAAPAAPVASRRRVERGPSKALLAALGIGVVSAIAALVIVLGPSGGESVEQGAVAPPPPAPAPTAATGQSAAPAPTAPAAAPPAPAPAAAALQAKPVPAPAAAAPEAARKAAAASAAVPAAAPTKAEAPAATPASPDDDSEEGAPEALLRAGRQALSADDAEAAEKIARDALARWPQDHHAMELMVLALMDQDRGPEALPYARRMVQKRSRRVPYRLLLGDLLLMVGDGGAARAEWQKALALSPGDKAIKRRLGL